MAGSTKVKGIVVSSKDFKDKDKLITLFTLEEGLITASMRSVRGEKAKLKFAKEIFCFGEYILENTRGMNIVTQVEIIDNFFGLTGDIEKYYESCALLDIVNKTAGAQADAKLFIALLKALKTLCYEKVQRFYVLNKFLIEIFTELGYSFITTKCSSCGAKLSGVKYLNLDIGELICPACRNNMCVQISETCYAGLKILDNTEFDKLQSIKLAVGSELECYKLLEKNFEWRFGKRFMSMNI